MKDYSRTIHVSASPTDAYVALTRGFSQWWTKTKEGFTEVGDEVMFTFPPNRGYWRFKAVVLDPMKKIEIECVEAMHIHEGKPKAIEKEWLGTKVIWTLHENENQTEIKMRHIGLLPHLLCYEICVNGWDYFFFKSLAAYLNTGIGFPHGSDQARIP